MCCTSETGCGILKPDWLSNASFVGYTTMGSFKIQIWEKDGLQNNFYWQVDATQVPFLIDEQPTNIIAFNVASFKKGPIDPGVFTLPSYCSAVQNCPLLSLCSIAR